MKCSWRSMHCESNPNQPLEKQVFSIALHLINHEMTHLSTVSMKPWVKTILTFLFVFINSSIYFLFLVCLWFRPHIHLHLSKLLLFLNEMKIAKVANIAYYGPVSVLPQLSKVLEKVFSRRLDVFFEKHKLSQWSLNLFDSFSRLTSQEILIICGGKKQ